jgi:hypothetical protein
VVEDLSTSVDLTVFTALEVEVTFLVFVFKDDTVALNVLVLVWVCFFVDAMIFVV